MTTLASARGPEYRGSTTTTATPSIRQPLHEIFALVGSANVAMICALTLDTVVSDHWFAVAGWVASLGMYVVAAVLIHQRLQLNLRTAAVAAGVVWMLGALAMFLGLFMAMATLAVMFVLLLPDILPRWVAALLSLGVGALGVTAADLRGDAIAPQFFAPLVWPFMAPAVMMSIVAHMAVLAGASALVWLVVGRRLRVPTDAVAISAALYAVGLLTAANLG